MITRRHFGLSLMGSAALRAQDRPTFTPSASDVPVHTDVMRNQRPLRGLRAEDFILLENGQTHAIRGLTTEELPLDIVLVFHALQPGTDRISQQARARLLNGATSVLLRSRQDDRVAFLVHSSPARIELPFTNDHDAMADALERISVAGDRPGFSELVTLDYAVRMLTDLGRQNLSKAMERRRLIVRIGSITSRGVAYADEPLIQILLSERVTFSAIDVMWAPNLGFHRPDDALPGPGQNAPEPIGPLYRLANPFHIARATGGDSLIQQDPKDPFDLVTPLRQRYVLWFAQPDGLQPRLQRSISIDVSPRIRQLYPETVVEAPANYITR